MDKVEKLQNRQGARDFQHKGGNSSQNKTNFTQNRSQRPYINFDNKNRIRGNNLQRNDRPGYQARNNFARPNEQRNNAFNQQNILFTPTGKRSQVTFRGRNSTNNNLRSNIIHLNSTGNNDDGYFVQATVNEKPVALLCDSGANVTI